MNAPLQSQANGTKYSILWEAGEPDFKIREQRSFPLQQNFTYKNVIYMVPLLYRYIKAPLNIMREQYRKLLTAFISASNPSLQVKRLRMTTKAAEQQGLVENY